MSRYLASSSDTTLVLTSLPRHLESQWQQFSGRWCFILKGEGFAVNIWTVERLEIEEHPDYRNEPDTRAVAGTAVPEGADDDPIPF